MRLLLVEDEEDLANALAKGLRRQGYAVDVSFEGEEGWELAEINDYDLLILDLNLPKLDGLEVCRRVRSSQPHLLILLLTARGLPGDRVMIADALVVHDLQMGSRRHEILAEACCRHNRRIGLRQLLLSFAVVVAVQRHELDVVAGGRPDHGIESLVAMAVVEDAFAIAHANSPFDDP